MINIYGHFSHKQLNTFCKTGCGEYETMEHIYTCIMLNTTNHSISYQHIYNGNIQQQIKIFEVIKSNLEKRKFYQSYNKTIHSERSKVDQL